MGPAILQAIRLELEKYGYRPSFSVNRDLQNWLTVDARHYITTHHGVNTVSLHLVIPAYTVHGMYFGKTTDSHKIHKADSQLIPKILVWLSETD